MCSIGGELKRINKKLPTERDLCRKCKSFNAEISLKVDHFYCKTCFMNNLVHKFRSTIGKSKKIKHGDEILVAFSGSLSSTCLLNLLSSDGGRRKISSPLQVKKPVREMYFRPSILYVHDSSLQFSSTLMQQIQKFVHPLPFPAYYTFIEEVMREDGCVVINDLKAPQLFDEISNYHENNGDLDAKWKQFSSDFESPSSRRDAVNILRKNLICRCAKILNLSKVFLATSGTTLAVEMLSGVALGRGAHSADLVNFSCHLSGVEVFQPMRELYEDELKHYARLNYLHVSYFEEPSQGKNEKDIFSCTKSFLSALEENFVSTVPTIVRTGSKLLPSDSVAIKNEGKGQVLPCDLCGLVVDIPDSEVFCAVGAVNFSRRLIRSLPHDENIHTREEQQLSVNKANKAFGASTTEFSNLERVSNLCFGCTNLLEKKVSKGGTIKIGR